MNMKTKQLVGLGVLAVVGYLVYDNMKKKEAADKAKATTTPATTAPASFAGDAGKRVKFVGASGSAIAKPKERLFVGANGWANADSLAESSTKFFSVKDSGFK